MIWKKHLEIPEGSHAMFSPSQYHWMNYDPEKLKQVYLNQMAVKRGTELHAFACTCITLKQKLPKSKKTLNMYVNDAIGFNMQPEQKLFYSRYFYGTADAISFKNDILRIHDLKTGVTPASLHQLEAYAALFFLDYDIRPGDVQMELRIYQNDDILYGYPSAIDILPIMDKIKLFNNLIEEIEGGEV